MAIYPQESLEQKNDVKTPHFIQALNELISRHVIQGVEWAAAKRSTFTNPLNSFLQNAARLSTP